LPSGRQAAVCLLLVCALALLPEALKSASPEARSLPDPSIQLIKPEPRGGKAYRLVYLVPVPLDIYWRFKTDFDSSFVEGNEFIEEHRFLHRKGNVVVTENRYTLGSDAPFRWRTTVYPEQHRLEFTLLNPEECGQRFHHGYIEAKGKGQRTKVMQVAFFDFFGASIWVHYPWSGGLRDFLRTTARWEQQTVAKLRDRYATKP
jgi:hypothetical protein